MSWQDVRIRKKNNQGALYHLRIFGLLHPCFLGHNIPNMACALFHLGFELELREGLGFCKDRQSDYLFFQVFQQNLPVNQSSVVAVRNEGCRLGHLLQNP